MPAEPKQRRRKRSGAARLVDRVLTTGALGADELARELLVTPRLLQAFRDGRVAMPLERQLCLALLVRARVPALRGAAETVKAQVAAALAYHAHRVELHTTAPLPWKLPFGHPERTG